MTSRVLAISMAILSITLIIRTLKGLRVSILLIVVLSVALIAMSLIALAASLIAGDAEAKVKKQAQTIVNQAKTIADLGAAPATKCAGVAAAVSALAKERDDLRRCLANIGRICEAAAAMPVDPERMAEDG